MGLFDGKHVCDVCGATEDDLSRNGGGFTYSNNEGTRCWGCEGKLERKTGDVHEAVAAAMFGVDPKDVTPEQRRAGRTANFPVLHADYSRLEARTFVADAELAADIAHMKMLARWADLCDGAVAARDEAMHRERMRFHEHYGLCLKCTACGMTVSYSPQRLLLHECSGCDVGELRVHSYTSPPGMCTRAGCKSLANAGDDGFCRYCTDRHTIDDDDTEHA